MKNNEFLRKFFYGLIHDCYEYQDNNTDIMIYGGTRTSNPLRNSLKDKFFLFARRYGFVRRRFSIEQATQRLMYTLANIDKLERFYYLLGDGYSRQLLIELLKYRILGEGHVKLPLNDKKYWELYFSINKKFLKEKHTIRTWKFFLNRYQFQGLSGPINHHNSFAGILNAFCLEQYAYRRGGVVIRVQPGDVVIDAGGCWGEVALYFADNVGAEGKVYCFEFAQNNLNILQQNMTLNSHLADRIKIIPKPLWNKSGESMSYYFNGPATSLVRGSKQGNMREVSTLTIDDLVKKEGIKRVDFIKMDIEGAELKALQGAEETISAFRPNLAISVYHKDEDFIVIPDYLDKLCLGYKFFLDHFTLHSWETVLFASPTERL